MSSGTWLRFPVALPSDPRIKRTARELSIEETAFTGYLMGLLAYFLEYAPAGVLDERDVEGAIRDGARWRGEISSFIAALATGGFLSEDGLTLLVRDEFLRSLIESRAAAQAKSAHANHVRWHQDTTGDDCAYC